MVFSQEMEPKRGQEFRDRVRCEALESIGMSAKTLDNKHSILDTRGKHCEASFTDARRMLQSISAIWGEPQFDYIILDYFFSPVDFYLI
jgi:hypothetical protein